MNREILYRGKRIDNGEWVFGNRLYDDISGKQYIIPFGNIEESEMRGHEGCCYCVGFEIIPETIGQYTGLKDKNGKKIFEGDILRFTRGGNEYIGKVVYEQRICGLDLWCNKVVGAYGEKATFRVNLTEPTKLEVIGNIYDNPELLEVE